MWTVSRILGVFAATLALGGIASVIIVEMLSWYWVDEEFLFYSIMAGLVLLPVTVCVRSVETGRGRPAGVVGIFCGAAVLSSLLILFLNPGSVAIEQSAALTGAVSSVVLLYCALYGGLQAIQTRLAWVRIARAGSLIGGAIAAGLAVVLLLLESGYVDLVSVDTREAMLRAAAIVVVGTGFLSVVALVLNRILEDAEEGGTSVERLPLPVNCPRCETSSTLQTGGDVCPACGLEIRVVLQ